MIGKNRVVITGVGVLAANGIGKEAFWNSLLAGESGIGPITQFDASDLPCSIAGEVSNFTPSDFINPEMKPHRMARYTQLAVSATKLALKDSGITPDRLQKTGNFPIVIGVSSSDFKTILDKPRSYSVPTLVPHSAATSIAAILKLNCELTTLSNACASGLDAIALGASKLRDGKADIALAGGADSSITQKTYSIMCRGNMLPTNMNDLPEKASRPFDLHRSGGIPAEGAGIVVLETETHALARGAHIYAEVLGHGMQTKMNDAENELAQYIAMKIALANSGLHARQIDYLNAHAPSDPALDYIETIAIKNILSQYAYTIPISSIKGATGNPLAAGGSLQCITTALAIKQSLIPPTTNFRSVDPDCDLDYVPNSSRQHDIHHALINSRGVGSNCSSIILKAYD